MTVITLKNYMCVQPKQVELTACHNQMQKLISLWTGKVLLETDSSLTCHFLLLDTQWHYSKEPEVFTLYFWCSEAIAI